MKKITKLIKNKKGLATFTPLWFILIALAVALIVLLIFLNL